MMVRSDSECNPIPTHDSVPTLLWHRCFYSFTWIILTLTNIWLEFKFEFWNLNVRKKILLTFSFMLCLTSHLPHLNGLNNLDSVSWDLLSAVHPFQVLKSKIRVLLDQSKVLCSIPRVVNQLFRGCPYSHHHAVAAPALWNAFLCEAQPSPAFFPLGDDWKHCSGRLLIFSFNITGCPTIAVIVSF